MSDVRKPGQSRRREWLARRPAPSVGAWILLGLWMVLTILVSLVPSWPWAVSRAGFFGERRSPEYLRQGAIFPALIGPILASGPFGGWLLTRRRGWLIAAGVLVGLFWFFAVSQYMAGR